MKVEKMIEQLEGYNWGECAKNNPTSLRNVKMLLDELSDKDLISDWEVIANECEVLLAVSDDAYSGRCPFSISGDIRSLPS